MPIAAPLQQAGVQSGATKVVFTGGDGYTAEITRADLQADKDAIITADANGVFRNIIPTQMPKVWVKSLVKIDVHEGYTGWADGEYPRRRPQSIMAETPMTRVRTIATPAPDQPPRGRPVAWLLIASLPMLGFLLLPLLALLLRIPLAQLLANLANREVAQATSLSMITTALTVVLTLLFGTPVAYLLARRRFRRAARRWIP